MGLCTSLKKKAEGVIEFALLFSFQLRKSDDSSSLANDEYKRKLFQLRKLSMTTKYVLQQFE